MKFKTTKLNKNIKRNKVYVTAKVDHNDTDYNTQNSSWTEKEFDELFDLFLALGKIVGKDHGLSYFYDTDVETQPEDISDALYDILPTSEEYACCGNNGSGHTLEELKVTYFDKDGIEYKVDLTKPL